jgi:hypothetical protein
MAGELDKVLKRKTEEENTENCEKCFSDKMGETYKI